MLGQPVDVEPPDQPVDLDGALAEYLREPPLCGTAQHGHLPEPVLRMGISQPEIDVGVILAKDMWHVRVIAHDLDWRGDPRGFDGAAVIGQRLRGEEVDQSDAKRDQKDQGSGNPQ